MESLKEVIEKEEEINKLHEEEKKLLRERIEAGSRKLKEEVDKRKELVLLLEGKEKEMKGVIEKMEKNESERKE